MSVAEDLNRAATKAGKQRNLVLAALVVIIAYGVYRGGASIQEDLHARSVAALEAAALPADRVSVSIEGRTAKLTGFADDPREADAAATAVAGVLGIDGVENFLQVKQTPLLSGPAGEPPNAAAELLAATQPDASPAATPNETPAADATDQASTEATQATREATPVSSVSHLRADWRNGHLTLTGALASEAEHRRVTDTIQRAYGAATVVDEIRIQPELASADWLDGFVAHLPKLREQASASMESSAAGLRPDDAAREKYVIAAPASDAAPVVAAAPPTTKPAATAVTPKAAAAAPAAAESAPAVQPTPDDWAAAVADAQAGEWLHVRSQLGRVAISGVLGSERQRQALAASMRLAYAPNVTFNAVQLGAAAPAPAWLDALNSLWVLLQPVESLDLEISAKGVSVGGWTPSEDQSRRILATLADKFAPLAVHSTLRSIQSQQESYAVADFLNRNFANGVGFARDGVSLSWAGHVTLAQIAKRLRRQPAVRLSIGVHTDARGDAAANRLLTQKRADAIVARLVELGIEPQRIQGIGYGDSRPIADNRTPVGRALNRRVVFSPM